jgi:hypothetical protein
MYRYRLATLIIFAAALKTKAEELARAVGPKALRNQLRVLSGK